MSPMIEAPNSVLLLVGREDFTPPQTFGGEACVATHDCIAVGVLSVDDGPTLAALVAERAPSGLRVLGDFSIESEGLLSFRDIYNREYDSAAVEPGPVRVSVLGTDTSEPGQVYFVLGVN